MIARPEQLLIALIGEAAVGYPAALFAAIGHPVTWMGAGIGVLDRGWNRGGPARRRAAGVAVMLLLIAVAAGAGWAVEMIAGGGWGVAVVILIATTGLAQRSLDDHVRAVARPLLAGNLSGARLAVGRIVGRDTDALDERGVALAATESLAESLCDGVVAPALWFLIAGLPGLLVCKAINTADSMIGHRDDRYRWFGWAAARLDDGVNWVPARLSGLLVAVAGGGGIAVMLRDARRHASPNGGWPEAAMAGALHRRLGGPVRYDGEMADRAWLGDGPLPDAADLGRALRIYRRACLLLWLMVGVVAWAR
ncbi:adenosylcobinamide-phosphate synthase CbiB [Sphingomonas sp. BGYR3]|uniref:adenosylcobinamide-phosphate synthase CbiB n=1 Tax=Sphingomonas sp. BGYR3 TaxID=2975483 RepID=UPI0021A5312B|nr:adenosylcobinamide-phosphate synthase CbiB [Sphingomonas sp. BGYR3]MDG5489853.1 adenosylcobinamide-phosphate synthase CbiB [Sphingomonas sp. BGYR3]